MFNLFIWGCRRIGRAASLSRKRYCGFKSRQSRQMKIGQTIFLRKKRVELGEGHVTQYTVFENKKLGGIWFYSWGKVGGESGEGQCRFHTHAFNSYAFTLKGSYDQEVIDENGIRREQVKKLFRPRFLPRNYTHRVINAEPNTWTCVIFGKWSKFWFEYFSNTNTWVKYTHGRNVTEKFTDTTYTDIKKLITNEI